MNYQTNNNMNDDNDNSNNNTVPSSSTSSSPNDESSRPSTFEVALFPHPFRRDEQAFSPIMDTTTSVPRRPMRARNSYNLFFKHHRQVILMQQGGTTTRRAGGFAQIASTIAQLWSKASEEEKQVFAALAEQDRARFRREMEEWNRKDDNNNPQDDRQ